MAMNEEFNNEVAVEANKPDLFANGSHDQMYFHLGRMRNRLHMKFEMHV